jgi:SNF2 family DNA or RNA helicase
MFCSHPFLINPRKENPAIVSPKYQRLIEILEEIITNGEKVLIFTSFSEMIALLVGDIPNHFPGIYIGQIDGQIPVEDRQKIVDDFNNFSGAAVLVLNPKAAGTGLNLTGANHVIHYNPEWNPAVEDQASARAYRRGQKRPVTIHRLIYLDTVEEIINERLDRKRDIFREAVVGTTGKTDEYQDIARALKITPFRGDTDD